MTSGSSLNQSKSGRSGDLGDMSSSTRLSNVEGSRSGSSVASSDLYHAEALVNAPSTPSDDGSGEQGGGGSPSLSPESGTT